MIEKHRSFRLVTTVTPDAERVQSFVHCPDRGESIDASDCGSCSKMRFLEWDPVHTAGQVVCAVEPGPPVDPRVDFAEEAARTRLHELMDPAASVSVTVGLSIERLRVIFLEHKLRAVTVVDPEGKLVSIVSRSDLLAAPAEGTVADVMRARVHALPEDAPVSYAVALMAFENINEVPVVSNDGTVLGICHATDALRWVAGRIGYAVPDAKRASRWEVARAS